MSDSLTIDAQGDLEVRITRRFNAPRELVFDSWTKPELLQQWLGIRGGWTMPVCEIDLRVGGTYRYVWEKGTHRMGVGGTYREIVRPRRIVATELFDDAWYDGESIITHVLEERAGQTESILTMLYASTHARDQVLASPMEVGLEEGFANLDALLLQGRG